ncbi:MAG TPA: ubiquinone/menaquinone biosynthesis methyltransferase [Actinomycetota bacterium]|nr:ubiquinone/menaquinone biosynthesis methyltransferase [Actinomycetota bacterium]
MARLDRLPVGRAKVEAVRSMFDSIAPRYDLVNRVMTFGMDVGWRRASIRSLAPRRGDLVLDVACGTGDFCRALEKRGHRVVGVDFSMGMLRAARTAAPLLQGDALRLPFRDGTVDGVTCGFALRNVTDVGELFDEIARVVRPGGRIALLEVSEPKSRVLRAGHHLYFNKIVPFIGGLLSDRDAYGYLPRSTAYLPPTDALLERLRSAGFVRVAARHMGLGAVQLLTGARS